MDVLVSLKERKKNAALREQLGLEPVSLVIKKGRLRGERERCLYWTVVVRGDTRVDFEPVHLCKHNVIVRLNLCTPSW